MERNFYIDNIKDTDDINRLSLALNEMEEVAHIKILKTSINFNCARPENVQKLLEDAGLDYVLKEEINSRKREYVAPEKKVEKIFMFTNLDNEEDAKQIEDVLSKYSVYENVSVDYTNKLLKLTTSKDNVIIRLNRLIQTINPNITVEQWKKPFKSQDIFAQKYLNRYIRIAALLVAGAIGLVTRADPTILTNFAWLIALIVISEKPLQRAKKDIQVKQYLSENVVMMLACLAGWAFGAFLEAIIVSIIYQAGDALLVVLINWTMAKVDDLVNPTELGRRLTKDGMEMVPLDDIDIGDVIVVRDGETIPLGGNIVKGRSSLDVYALNGADVYEKSRIKKEVHSGTVVVDGELQIKVSSTYDKSAMNKVLEIAMNAPTSKSRTHEIIDQVSKLYTRIVVVIALLCCTVIPLMDLTQNVRYLYLGAIMLTVSGSFAYKQAASFGLLAGVGKAFSKKIIIKENSGLDDLNLCRTIIYDRFDGIEVTEDEMDLFAKIKKLHKDLIIFNDGPVDLENDQYNIYNNLSIEEKLDIMDNASIAGQVAYIGDCDKDVALLQKAHVGISRGGVHNKRVTNNSDIMLMDSSLDTIIDMLKISKKQKHVTVENIFIGMAVSICVILTALSFVMPWYLSGIIYVLESVLVLLNTHRIIEM